MGKSMRVNAREIVARIAVEAELCACGNGGGGARPHEEETRGKKEVRRRILIRR